MVEAEIHFRGEPFMARVVGMGNEPVKCTPVVYDERSCCGVGILHDDGKVRIWGMSTPRNLIVAWRATEILRRLDSIEAYTLCAAYYAGARDSDDDEEDTMLVEQIIAHISRAAYDEIMAMPVPEQIIRAVLDNQKGDFPPDLYPITDEVRAGTIEWRQEFADAGIEHPDREAAPA